VAEALDDLLHLGGLRRADLEIGVGDRPMM